MEVMPILGVQQLFNETVWELLKGSLGIWTKLISKLKIRVVRKIKGIKNLMEENKNVFRI